MGVGAYITDDTYERGLRHADCRSRTTCTPSRSRGPREDGGFKPEIVAPGRGDLDHADVAGRRPGGRPYALPPGYRCSTAPRWPRRRRPASAALLVSAAKQAGVPAPAGPDPAGADARPRGTSPRRPVPALRPGQRPDRRRRGVGPAEDQHQDGRHHVVGAGQHASSAASSRRRASARASTTARASPPGTSYTRTYTFTRTDGGRRHEDVQPVAGSATTARSASGGVDRAAARAAGEPDRRRCNPTQRRRSTRRSCASTIRARPGIDYQTMNTVIAADAFTARERLASHITRHDRRGSRRSTTSSASRRARRRSRSTSRRRRDRGRGAAIRFLRWHPYGARHRLERGVELLQPAGPGGTCTTGSATSRTVSNPQAVCGRSRSTRGAPPTYRRRAVHPDGVDPRGDASRRTRT